ncbi:MAG: aminodeoxychorismate synthase component I [Shewanella algae]
MYQQAICPPAIRVLDWQLSTLELFSHFSSEPWAMLLDSADAQHNDARYDIIVAEPIARLVTMAETTQISEASGVRRSSDDPFALLQQLLQQYFPNAMQVNLPFSGGAVGAFSYDLGRRLEKLPKLAAADIALPEMNVGLYDWALIRDKELECWQLVHYRGEKALTEILSWLTSKVTNSPNKHLDQKAFRLSSEWRSQLSREQYGDKFAKVQQYLHSGDCYQINLTQRFQADYQGDEWQAYRKLRQANGAPFSAFIRLEHNCILSISPERFIALDSNRHIETKPIKGTLPRSADEQQDRELAKQLAGSEKDRAENLMIVDLLRNDIGKVASPGSVAVPHLFAIESFPAVHHLVSTVTAELAPGYQATDLLRAAFPGGSITGAPKIRAMEIIEELEPSRRSLYCGAIGYLSQDGKMDSSITIRTLVADSGQLYCWAGGGIVADSDVDAEYQETYDKVSRILPLLAPEPDSP